MKKKAKRVYVTPESKVYAMADELLIKPASVNLDAPHSNDEDWDNNEDIDGGEIEF
jgi:hypothetical protein